MTSSGLSRMTRRMTKALVATQRLGTSTCIARVLCVVADDRKGFSPTASQLRPFTFVIPLLSSPCQAPLVPKDQTRRKVFRFRCGVASRKNAARTLTAFSISFGLIRNPKRSRWTSLAQICLFTNPGSQLRPELGLLFDAETSGPSCVI